MATTDDASIKEAFTRAAEELKLFVKFQGNYVVIDRECDAESKKELELQAAECSAHLDAKAKKEEKDKKKQEKENKINGKKAEEDKKKPQTSPPVVKPNPITKPDPEPEGDDIGMGVTV